MSTDAFACILQLFIIVNEHEGLLVVTVPPPLPAQKLKSYTSYSNVSGPSYIQYSFNRAETPPEIRPRVHPNKLDGIEVFWGIVQQAGNKEVTEKARDFLNRMYTRLHVDLEAQVSEIRGDFIATYLNKLEALIESKDTTRKGEMLSRMVRLMKDMIDESESKGTGGLKSHLAILQGEDVILTIHNSVTTGKTVPKKLMVGTHSNVTVWELKQEIGKYFECGAECMKLTMGGRELKDSDHGRTLGEFVQGKRFVAIRAEKRNMDHIPRVPLLTDKGSQLTEKAKKVFADIFDKFAKNGKLDAEGAARFIKSTTGEPIVTSTDNRVQMLFKSFDSDKDGFLDARGFQEFYRDSLSHGREDTVWQNLRTHGYRNDLRSVSESEQPVVDIKTLPRYMLSKNPRSFDLFFRILDLGQELGDAVWDLITRLSTNELIHAQIWAAGTAATEVEPPLWETLMGAGSVYGLLYRLQIVQSFVEENGTKEDWRDGFVQRGGVAYLAHILTSGVLVNPKSRAAKECVGIVASILARFVRSAAFVLRDGLCAAVLSARCKRHVSARLYADEQSEEEAPNLSSAVRNTNEESEEKVVAQPDVKELFAAKPSTVFYLPQDEARQQKSDFDLPKPDAELLLGSSVNLKDLLCRQVELIGSVLLRQGNSGLHSDDELMLKSALQLFSSCVLADGKLFALATSHTSGEATLDKLIPLGLFCPRSQEVREELSDVLLFLCYLLREDAAASPLGYVLHVLLDNIPKKAAPEVRDCAEFFHLLGKLIDLHYSSKADAQTELDSTSLLDSMLQMLKQHRSAEKRDSLIEDKLLVGIITTIRKLLSHNSGMKEDAAIAHGLLHELFFSCLFPSLAGQREIVASERDQSIEAQKCKSRESRAAAYKLLATLCKGSLVCQSFLVRECLEPLCRSIRPHKGWAYIPSSESRSKLGYAGLENLGCVCYMLSMMQQFYMIPTFRYGLLAADDQKPPTSSKPDEADENILHQFQRIFAYLELTERQDFSPAKFCFAFKDVEGRPTDISKQQDAQEFLNLIFDRLENHLRATPEKYLLQSIFGGKTCSQIICKGGCGSVNRNYEDFYNLSVGVKGHKTLFESLNKYISGETISDYFCEKCKKKVEVVKRTCVDSLPNVLIIHLQRIIFNYDTCTNEKINSRLDFPKEFSIEPYTVEGIEAAEHLPKDPKSVPDQFHGKGELYYQYKLVGVVVHFGTADMGHYYSYININRGSNALHIANPR